ncbi:MAG TPA: hypothetical protein PK054_05535 [Anaerohalosphaeraceae bacterium]|nr:hypothetical protein [Anaerohalosphaeraceae bacterium]HOL88169.1 hypothetical protein [Anaerohalosphaeraceae bacterium]HPP56028.1 hypothetical protein [Anaerohalosphaeraceae bacterium]
MESAIEREKTEHTAGSAVYMRVRKVNEAGYEAALLGLSHNKKQCPEKMEAVARRLADKDGGHNKFLESIIVWLDVRAPRYWWQEADTFRLSTKQSESTMHTLSGELLAVNLDDADAVAAFLEANFEPDSCSLETLRAIHQAAVRQDIVGVKKRLPEGFLQTRLWCMSYRTLRNIILQRRTHRLPHWREFIRQTLEQVEHPELLPGLVGE